MTSVVITATPELKYSSMPGRCARTFARDFFPRGGASGPGERSLRASVRRAVTSRAAAPGSLTGDCPNARERAQQQRDRQ